MDQVRSRLPLWLGTHADCYHSCSWTWKTESGTAEDWSYIQAVQNGWIPQNLNKKLYSDTCSQYGY